MTEELNIRRGVSEDIPELVRLYDETVGHLESHVNYPGWKKGVYPGRDAAEEGVETGTLYVAETGGRIIGSIILNGKQEAAYNGGSWGVEAEPGGNGDPYISRSPGFQEIRRGEIPDGVCGIAGPEGRKEDDPP